MPPRVIEPTATAVVPGVAQNAIEADSDIASSDDGYESDRGGSLASTSLTAGVRDYVFENNRRYHRFREGHYLLPNDDIEQEREDMKHAMVVHVCDGWLHFAPLDNPQKILDIGTGTGIWAIDMADEYPSAEVIGIDLSPIQPGWVPPNVRFLVDDAESDWGHGRGKFDYVHARHMCMAIKDWPKLLQQAYDALKPGGWIELQELRFVVSCDDGTMPPNYGFSQWLRYLIDGLSRFGVDLLGMEKNGQKLLDAGFVNVEEKVWKIPIGTWAKQQKMKTIGAYNRAVISDALAGVSMAPFTRGLGWRAEEVEVFAAKVRNSLSNSRIHSYYTFHAVYGQKPK
ncbi:methyltransferase domain-containing protein [Echria macrotheca]|uniref:Methyltransferase domain-containing protein n=1 Tax=Echria macrotheca TaxID=438768 RepID=A0AAJ0B7A7_9PEZI|nr:methyltransferase domain-containing protein [Echria macrotheca]